MENENHWRDIVEYKVVEEQHSSDRDGKEYLTEILNKHGLEGWELCHYQVLDSSLVMIFKRVAIRE